MLTKKQIPNLLTFGRIACVPLLLLAFYTPWLWLPLIIMLLASISDFFDGKLARKWGVESDLGRLLDPNADKLLIAAALIMLTTHGYAHAIAVTLILCRELFVSGLRELMAERKIIVHVTALAKWKTTSQMLAAILLLIAYGQGSDTALYQAGCFLLWASTFLTLLTGWQYFQRSLPHLNH